MLTSCAKTIAAVGIPELVCGVEQRNPRSVRPNSKLHGSRRGRKALVLGGIRYKSLVDHLGRLRRQARAAIDR
jgi:hypothetical protein